MNSTMKCNGGSMKAQVKRVLGSKRIAVVSCLLLTGCMQSTGVVSADRPDWLSTESVEYPNAQYVTANGSAEDPERAKNRALANLAKVFELRIRESSTAIQDVQSRKQDGDEDVISSQRLTQNVQTQTSKIIDGARIAEQWFDKVEFTHYAFAVLDRKQAGNNIRSEIERLDAETQHELNRLQQSAAIQQVALLSKALSLQAERAALQKTLKVIDLSGRGMPAQWNLAQLREQMDNALLKMRMALAIKNDDMGELANVVGGAMGKAGFPANNTAYDYILTSSFDAQPAFQNQGWHWLRGTLVLQLTDASGRVMGNRSWPIKVSSAQPEMLTPRARAKVENILNAELKAAVLAFAAGDN